MSTLLISDGREILSTTFPLYNLKKVPRWDVPFVGRGPHSAEQSVANESRRSSIAGTRTVRDVHPCFITNTMTYLSENAHWINAIRGKESKHVEMQKKIARFLFKQGIVPLNFKLDHVSNLASLPAELHSGMDKFALFAVTCSETTLNELIGIVHRQNMFPAERGEPGEEQDLDFARKLQASIMAESAKYELVVLQPTHFLPQESTLTSYLSGTPKYYRLDAVGALREVPAAKDSPRYPSFDFPTRKPLEKLNPYLVILAAEMKFRRYRRAPPPSKPLDPYYNNLIEKTIYLASLLYWKPNQPYPEPPRPVQEHPSPSTSESNDARMEIDEAPAESPGILDIDAMIGVHQKPVVKLPHPALEHKSGSEPGDDRPMDTDEMLDMEFGVKGKGKDEGHSGSTARPHKRTKM